jgi:hypothetical protein
MAAVVNLGAKSEAALYRAASGQRNPWVWKCLFSSLLLVAVLCVFIAARQVASPVKHRCRLTYR